VSSEKVVRLKRELDFSSPRKRANVSCRMTLTPYMLFLVQVIHMYFIYRLNPVGREICPPNFGFIVILTFLVIEGGHGSDNYRYTRAPHATFGEKRKMWFPPAHHASSKIVRNYSCATSLNTVHSVAIVFVCSH
jgi:hypothetical protein